EVALAGCASRESVRAVSYEPTARATADRRREIHMSNQKVIVHNSAAPLGLLGVAFVCMKLLGFIDWSWWWVTAPFWGVIAFYLAMFAILLLIALVLGAIMWFGERYFGWKKKS